MTTENKKWKIIDGEEFTAFDSEQNIIELETGTIVEQIEKEDYFCFIYEGKEYWQYWYSAEEFIEEIK